MIRALISDFSKVLLFRKGDTSTGKLNELHQELLQSGDYDFWEYFSLNSELLEYYRKISSKIEVYLYTSEYIQEYPPVVERIGPVFKEIYSAARLNLSKIDPNGYLEVAKLIQKAPEEIVFVEDTLPNIEAASEAGIQTISFTDTATAVQKIGDILVRI